jgi:hypothetical protein
MTAMGRAGQVAVTTTGHGSVEGMETKIVAEDPGDLASEAIDDAFKEKIGDLFNKLVTNLIVKSDTRGGGEKISVEEFSNGLNFARRARELAQNVAKGATKAQSGAKQEST